VPPVDPVATARAFSKKVHAGQHYGAQEYTVHLEHALSVARRFANVSPPVEAAILLHDSKEDCGVTDAELREIGIPEETIAIVSAVTNEPGANRRARAERTYPKIAASRDAVFVKLADRIANFEAGGTERLYTREHAAFRNALYRPEHGLDRMWEYLDQLVSGYGTE